MGRMCWGLGEPRDWAPSPAPGFSGACQGPKVDEEGASWGKNQAQGPDRICPCEGSWGKLPDPPQECFAQLALEDSRPR